MSLASGLLRALDWVSLALFALAAAGLAALVAVTSVEVLLRYAFDAPTHWAADSVGYLLAAVVMLALPEVTRRQGHVAITFLSERSPWPRAQARSLALAAGLVCLGAAWIVSEEAARQLARGVLTQGAAPIPKVWITGTVVVGFAVSGLVFLRTALAPIKGG